MRSIERCLCTHRSGQHTFSRGLRPEDDSYGRCSLCLCERYTTTRDLKPVREEIPYHPFVRGWKFYLAALEMEPESKIHYRHCGICGHRRKCIEGMCHSCIQEADSMVGL
jgi:hypothetical protein